MMTARRNQGSLSAWGAVLQWGDCRKASGYTLNPAGA